MVMAFDFAGKRVVVCGGSRGIGRSIALGFAAGGRRRVDLRARRRGAGGRPAPRSPSSATPRTPALATWPTRGDQRATSPRRRRRSAASTCWSTTPRASASADDEAGWAASMAVDMMAIVRATQAALPFLKESKGNVVNISSISALRPRRAAPLRRDQGRGDPLHRDPGGDVRADGIRVNGVAPGSIEFPGGSWEKRKTDNPNLYNAILRSIPFGRLGRPEEVANAGRSWRRPSRLGHRPDDRGRWGPAAVTCSARELSTQSSKPIG